VAEERGLSFLGEGGLLRGSSRVLEHDLPDDLKSRRDQVCLETPREKVSSQKGRSREEKRGEEKGSASWKYWKKAFYLGRATPGSTILRKKNKGKGKVQGLGRLLKI